MKVIKKENEFGLNVFLQENGKKLAFTFGGNGDLYWTIYNKSNDENKEYNYDSFIITKENYAVYSLFEQLFYDIENINIFDEIVESENEKKRYRLFNRSNYNELFNSDKKTITWYSDETSSDVSNILKIKKEENNFKIEFYIQPYIDGYDEDFHSKGYIPIRFRNSGSSYDSFNVLFMRMYNNMPEIDDTSDIGHQIHIEEYIYKENQEKKLVR